MDGVKYGFSNFTTSPAFLPVLKTARAGKCFRTVLSDKAATSIVSFQSSALAYRREAVQHQARLLTKSQHPTSTFFEPSFSMLIKTSHQENVLSLLANQRYIGDLASHEFCQALSFPNQKRQYPV